MKRTSRNARTSRARRLTKDAPRGLVSAPRVYAGAYVVTRDGLVTLLTAGRASR